MRAVVVWPVVLNLRVSNVIALTAVQSLAVPPLAIGNCPVTPVVSGKLVQLVSEPDDGVPNMGVIKDGEVESTNDPLPVEVDTPVPPFNTGRIPVTPVVSESPVQLVSVPDAGVPNNGVTNVGEVERTFDPVPVDVVTPVPPLATKRVPEISVAGTVALAVIAVVPVPLT